MFRHYDIPHQTDTEAFIERAKSGNDDPFHTVIVEKGQSSVT